MLQDLAWERGRRENSGFLAFLVRNEHGGWEVFGEGRVLRGDKEGGGGGEA